MMQSWHEKLVNRKWWTINVVIALEKTGGEREEVA
jgi:hypothetical protein